MSKTPFCAFALALGLLSGCADSFYTAQARPDAKEIAIDGRVIRVIDEGEKVQMVRKGLVQSGSDVDHWEDFIKAGEKATGCKIENVVPRPGTSNSLVWVEALKKCKP